MVFGSVFLPHFRRLACLEAREARENENLPELNLSDVLDEENANNSFLSQYAMNDEDDESESVEVQTIQGLRYDIANHKEDTDVKSRSNEEAFAIIDPIPSADAMPDNVSFSGSVSSKASVTWNL
jgi:hypothetical protein